MMRGPCCCRELWYRASMAWQHILASPAVSPLVVAHNAVNQVPTQHSLRKLCVQPTVRVTELAVLLSCEHISQHNISHSKAPALALPTSVKLKDLNAFRGCRLPPQALIGTAIGLPPEAFRLLLQSNGATTAICFAPAADGGAPAEAVVDHINQVSTDQPLS